MMDIYRDIMPTMRGYLTNACDFHLPRVELYILEISRRKALYFQRRSINDKEPEYATERYKEFYNKVCVILIDGYKMTFMKYLPPPYHRNDSRVYSHRKLIEHHQSYPSSNILFAHVRSGCYFAESI